MLSGSVKRIFTSGPAGPAGATLAAALSDVAAGLKAVLTAPDLPSARTAFGLTIGSSVQAWSATLDALAGLTTTTFGRSLLTQADAPAALGTLGAVSSARQVTAGAGLAGGGDLTADRAFSLAGIATGALLANTAAGPGSAVPVATTATALLDANFGSSRGTVLVRAASGWSALPLGTTGQTLQSNGTDLVFAAASPGSGAVRNDTAQNPNTAAIALALANVGALFTPQGRLTLTSGVPVLTAAVATAGTIFYTPMGGDLALVGTGLTTAPVPVVFAEVSQALTDTSKSPAAAAASNVYDLFAWLDGSTFRVTRGPAWSAGATAGSNLARGSGAGSTALTRVAGVLVNGQAIANGPAAGMGVYVGSIATDAGGATVTFNTGTAAAGGGAARIGLWNAYNRVPVGGVVADTTATWTYATPAWRAANGSATARATFVVGLAEDVWSGRYISASYGNSSGYSATGVGFNSTAAFTGISAYIPGLGGGATSPSAAKVQPLGLSYLSAIEYVSAGTTTFYGAQATGIQTGLEWEGRY